MVDLIDAYQVLNMSILDVINSINPLDDLHVEDKQVQVRMDEPVFSITDRQKVLNSPVIRCHNLTQYINKFYSIHLDESSTPSIDYLININISDIDLTEFGEFGE